MEPDLHTPWGYPNVQTHTFREGVRVVRTMCGDYVLEEELQRFYPYGATDATCMGCILVRFANRAQDGT